MGVLKSRPRGETTEVDTDGSWAISYGDMITLLLTFFILFFSTDSEKDRMKQMESALMIKLDSTAKFRGEAALAKAENREPASTEAPEFVGPKLFDAKVYKVGERLIVEFPQTSFFDLGKIELTSNGKRELVGFVKQYMPYAGNYVLGIRAYTDNKKVLKTAGRRFDDNLELSALRSVAAMRVLQQLGIPLSRMRIGGYGELNLTEKELTRAVANEDEYQKNGIALARKIVLVIEPETKEAL